MFSNDNRFCGDGIIPAKQEGGIDFQGVSNLSANVGSGFTKTVKPYGYSEFDSTSNSSSSFIYKTSSKKTNGRPLRNKKFQQ